MKGATLIVMLLVSVSAAGQTAQEPGVYLEQGDKPVALSAAAYAGTQSSNSVVKAKVSWTFRGAHSPLGVAERRPHFHLICGSTGIPLLMLCQTVASQPADVIIVRLDEKSDHRESQAVSGSMFGGHGGFDPKKTTTTTVTKRDDGSWDVSSTQDLKPGEYLLTKGLSPQGFDFRIQK